MSCHAGEDLSGGSRHREENDWDPSLGEEIFLFKSEAAQRSNDWSKEELASFHLRRLFQPFCWFQNTYNGYLVQNTPRPTSKLLVGISVQTTFSFTSMCFLPECILSLSKQTEELHGLIHIATGRPSLAPYHDLRKKLSSKLIFLVLFSSEKWQRGLKQPESEK